MSRLALLVGIAGCAGPTDADSDTGRPDTDGAVPDTYTFESRFVPGASSVDHGGQTFRHLLIAALDGAVGGLTGRIDTGWFPVEGEVTAELDFYYAFDSATSGSVPIGLDTDPPAVQQVWDDVAVDKDLAGKIAGNDPEGQHRDWSTALVGWDQDGVTSPESLVRTWFAELDAAAVARSNGAIPIGPDGAPVGSVALDAEGRDRRELLEKFLLGAVAYSQGADDYLDDDLEGSGLLSANASAEDGEPYSALEHAWDEAYGWFGAAHDYGDWPDERLDGDAYADTYAPDGAIDRTTEVSYGAAVSAGKRDLGAVAPTDLTSDAFAAFVEGRALITSADGELDPDQLAALQGLRDRAVGAWEAAIAASMVHYVNEQLVDTGKFGTPDWVYADHAKHWSELKGFALGLQFSPRSSLSDADFSALHEAIGSRPALPTDPQADIDRYRQGLLDARAILAAAYGFDPANLGDDSGLGGW